MAIDKYLDYIKNYLDSPSTYIHSHTFTVNGKLRNIKAYNLTDQENKKNFNQLKLAHCCFVKELEKNYSRSAYSYAYKKDCGILPCVQQHLHSSYFFKTDIHHFFETIDFDILKSKIQQYNLFPEPDETLDLFLSGCFFEGVMPIGFSSSPLLSDIYLHKIDECFQNRPNLVYTRYADDFLFSSPIDYDFDSIKKELEELLQIDKLTLNRSKTYTRHLSDIGQSIHFLGLNLVKKGDSTNIISISNYYIKETGLAISRYLKPSDSYDGNDLRAHVIGRLSFIKYCSTHSYNRLCKLIKIKCGLDLSDIESNLKV